MADFGTTLTRILRQCRLVSDRAHFRAQVELWTFEIWTQSEPEIHKQSEVISCWAFGIDLSFIEAQAQGSVNLTLTLLSVSLIYVSGPLSPSTGSLLTWFRSRRRRQRQRRWRRRGRRRHKCSKKSRQLFCVDRFSWKSDVNKVVLCSGWPLQFPGPGKNVPPDQSRQQTLAGENSGSTWTGPKVSGTSETIIEFPESRGLQHGCGRKCFKNPAPEVVGPNSRFR